MDLQTYVENAMKARRENVMADSDQFTLGKLISEFEKIVEKQKRRTADGKTKEATVTYDFEYLFPTEIDSWRGSYAELALNFVDGGEEEIKRQKK